MNRVKHLGKEGGNHCAVIQAHSAEIMAEGAAEALMMVREKCGGDIVNIMKAMLSSDSGEAMMARAAQLLKLEHDPVKGKFFFLCAMVVHLLTLESKTDRTELKDECKRIGEMPFTCWCAGCCAMYVAHKTIIGTEGCDDKDGPDKIKEIVEEVVQEFKATYRKEENE